MSLSIRNQLPGTVTAVTAYKLAGNLRTLYGTVLGPSARALYLSASGHG